MITQWCVAGKHVFMWGNRKRRRSSKKEIIYKKPSFDVTDPVGRGHGRGLFRGNNGSPFGPI